MKFKKIMCLGLALTMSLSLVACGSKTNNDLDDLKENTSDIADAIKDEAASSGVDLEGMLEDEYNQYLQEKEEKEQAKAEKEDTINTMKPDAEAINTAYDAFIKAGSGADVIKYGQEFNGLVNAYIEKWATTEYKSIATQELGNGMSRYPVPDYLIQTKAAFVDGVDTSVYVDYTAYYNPENEAAYIVCYKDNAPARENRCIVTENGVFTPDLAMMDDEPDNWIAFKDNKAYIAYAGYGDHSFINWCYDLAGDGSGVGNNEEIEFDPMSEASDSDINDVFDSIMKQCVRISNPWNS